MITFVEYYQRPLINIHSTSTKPIQVMGGTRRLNARLSLDDMQDICNQTMNANSDIVGYKISKGTTLNRAVIELCSVGV